MPYSHVEERVGDRVVEVNERRNWLSPGRALASLVGIVLAGIGAIAIVQGGIDGTLNIPLDKVLGITQSAGVGIVELIIGLLILVSAYSAADRSGVGFFGVLLFVGGVMGLATSAQVHQDLGFGNSTAWLFLLSGLACVVAAALPSMLSVRRDVHDVHEVRTD